MTKDKVIEQMRDALEVMQFRLRPEGVDDLPHIREALLDRVNRALAAAKAVEPQPERQPLTSEQKAAMSPSEFIDVQNNIRGITGGQQ